MDINTIRKLIKLVEESNITEFSVQEGDLKIRISKDKETKVVAPQIPFANYTAASTTNTEIQPQIQKTTQVVETKSSNTHEIKSPIVGTFYCSPSPDSPSFVKVGDRVSKGQVLCIIEAMKLMNEIESDIDGVVEKVLLENSSPVEYNQPLFLIKV